jgi:hypothetical protein
MSIAAIAGGVGFSYKTVDDSAEIEKYLNGDMSQGQVLGASTEDQAKPGDCPSTTPVIGWIDYSGKKLIKNDLGENQTPSSCFKTTQDANDAGYYLQS